MPNHPPHRLHWLTPHLRTIAEALALAIALTVIAHLAPALQAPHMQTGRGERYLISETSKTPPTKQLNDAIKADIQALNQQFSEHIIYPSIATLLLLWLGRSQAPRLAFSAYAAALWLEIIHRYLHPLNQSLGQLLSTEALSGLRQMQLALLFIAIISHRFLAKPPAQQAGQALAYPLFVLLSGLGLLFMADIAANGPIKSLAHPLLGLSQYRYWLAANILISLVAAWYPALNKRLNQLMAHIDGAALKPSVLGIALFAGLAATWFGGLAASTIDSNTLNLNKWATQKAAVIAEFIRLPMILISAWFIARWGEAKQNNLRFLLRMGLAAGLLLACFLALKDFGQFLITALVFMLIFSAWISTGRYRAIEYAVALCLVASMLSLIYYTLPYIAETMADYGKYTLLQRLQALDHPFEAEIDFLANLLFLRNETPPQGFGLGQVPWCGYQVDTNNCRGIHPQLPSDYAFVGLIALWGHTTAFVIASLLCIWLLSLCPGTRRGSTPTLTWAARIYALFLATQTMITIGASLGLTVLTGVPLPLLAAGKASLISCAFATALTINTEKTS